MDACGFGVITCCVFFGIVLDDLCVWLSRDEGGQCLEWGKVIVQLTKRLSKLNVEVVSEDESKKLVVVGVIKVLCKYCSGGVNVDRSVVLFSASTKH